MRTVTGAVLGLLGVLTLALDVVRRWYRGRGPEAFPVRHLVDGVGPPVSEGVWSSVLLPALAAALAGLVGTVLRLRSVMVLAGAAAWAVFGLWTAMGAGVPGFSVADVQEAVWNALGGGLALLAGAAVLPARRRHPVAGGGSGPVLEGPRIPAAGR